MRLPLGSAITILERNVMEAVGVARSKPVQRVERAERAVVAYVRVSTEEQASDGFGMAAQEAKVRAYATALGLPLAEVVTDDGESGSTLDRPALVALRERIRAGEVGMVIVAKLDRVSRSLKNLLVLFDEEFAANDVALVSVAEQFDTSTASGRLFFQLLGSFAEFERNVITERTSGGRKEKAKRGGYAGGRAPLGYAAQRGSKVLSLDEQGAETVRRIFDLADDGLSTQAIADRLNAEGHKTAEGKEFHAMQVWRTLKRRGTYEGGYSFGGVQAEKGEHAPILPKAAG